MQTIKDLVCLIRLTWKKTDQQHHHPSWPGIKQTLNQFPDGLFTLTGDLVLDNKRIKRNRETRTMTLERHQSNDDTWAWFYLVGINWTQITFRCRSVSLDFSLSQSMVWKSSYVPTSGNGSSRKSIRFPAPFISSEGVAPLMPGKSQNDH